MNAFNVAPSTKFEFDLEPPQGTDCLAAQMIVSREAERIERLQQTNSKRIGALQDVLQRWRKALQEKIGPETFGQITRLAEEQRRKRAGATQQLASPDNWDAYRRASKTAHMERAGVFTHAGVDLAAVSAINEQYQAQLEQAARPTAKPSPTLTPIPEGKVPADVLAGKGNPWTIFAPPFQGSMSSYGWSRTGGNQPDLASYVDRARGVIGHRSEWSNYDAGDVDSFFLDFFTALAMWYRPKKAGRLNLYVQARCGAAHTHVYLDDEFGWSSSSSSFWSYLTANVSPVIADEDETQSWYARITGSPDNRTYDNDWYTPNAVRWFHMVTTDPIPADAWSLIKIGTHDIRNTGLNDVSSSQSMRNMWLVEKVYADIA